MTQNQVPFFRPELTEAEIDAVASVLRSGWLTTGPKVAELEQKMADAVGARYAIGLNSGTAALHLATVALGLKRGDIVLVPTMTFAATAEVVRYAGAIPLLVDCDPRRLNLDLEHAEHRLEQLRAGMLDYARADSRVVGILPVHVGGLMIDFDRLDQLARRHRLWVVEDSAHAFPSACHTAHGWRRSGEGTAEVTCFSFYANKTITTGEGGMAVTDDQDRAAEMRSLSLHGLSNDAWNRYRHTSEDSPASKGSWDYRILAPGYKYNLTDVAAALGVLQLERAEEMRRRRQEIAQHYLEAWAELPQIELPDNPTDRLHSWHLFQIKLRLEKLAIDRDTFLERLREKGIGFSVHWRPLHLHPYYQREYRLDADELPVATEVWKRTISLPIFPAMRSDEVGIVVDAVRSICRQESSTPA